MMDGLYLEPERENMTKNIPLPDGSKKIDETTNALAEAVASVKKDREAKKKARVDYPDQGTSGSKDHENPVEEKKKPTRKVRQPKSIPTRRSKSAQKPPYKTADAAGVTKTTACQTVVPSTHTTSTHTTSTALPSSPPKTTPADIQQKTADVITSVVMTTVVVTPVVSTVVSQSQSTAYTSTTTVPSKTSSVPPTKRRRLILKDDDTLPPQTSSKSLALVTIPKPVPLSSVPMYKPLPPAGVQFPLEVAAVRDEIKSFYYEDDPAKRSLPSIKGYPWPKNVDEYLEIKAKQAEDI